MEDLRQLRKKAMARADFRAAQQRLLRVPTIIRTGIRPVLKTTGMPACRPRLAKVTPTVMSHIPRTGRGPALTTHTVAETLKVPKQKIRSRSNQLSAETLKKLSKVDLN